MLEEICKRGNWANARDSKGETPLGWLLTFGDTESAEAQSKALSVLINHGADVNLPTDADGYAPLHSAVVNPRSAVIAKLLEEGAKASTAMSDGTTPLHMLFMYVGQYELRETIESAKLLIAAGADIHAPNSSGTTPVDTIREYNKPEIAKALLTAVADAERN